MRKQILLAAAALLTSATAVLAEPAGVPEEDRFGTMVQRPVRTGMPLREGRNVATMPRRPIIDEARWFMWAQGRDN